MTSTSDFETSLRDAERDLREAATADDVRRLWRKHFSTLGHRALGRLLLGRPASELIERRSEGAKED